jgi:hypothetical protein
MNNDKHAGNVILLRTASLSLLIALILAWCLTFTIPIKIPFFLNIFVDTDALLSAHLDFLMMTMLLLGFYASKITLPKHVLWPMAIGSIGNPTLFLFGAIGLEAPIIMLIVLISISLTTYGYGMAAIKVLRYSFKPA